MQRLISVGCDGAPELVAPVFRQEGGCPDLQAFFAAAAITVEPMVQADRAVVTRRTTTVIPVARLEALDSSFKGMFGTSDIEMKTDFYFHLRRESGQWRLEGVRSLATPGFMEVLCFIDPSKRPTDKPLAEFAADKLMCASDDAIAAWYAERRDVFERLRAVVADRSFTGDYARGGSAPDRQFDAALERLGLRSFESQTGAGEGWIRCRGPCLIFTAAGITDNEVGVLWASAEEALPLIGPSRIIMLRPLGGGWWAFKTT